MYIQDLSLTFEILLKDPKVLEEFFIYRVFVQNPSMSATNELYSPF